MAQIRQVQVTFVPAEDRLLLRLASTAGEEFRFWITRRFLRLLRPVLDGLLAADPPVIAQADEEARRAVLSFREEQALARADFSQSFTSSAGVRPLGDAPVLLARAQARPRPEGGCVLALHPEHGNGVELALGADLLHSINHLLADALGRAQWDLATTRDQAGSAPATSARTLN